MKRAILLLITMTFFVGCNSYKKANKEFLSGNYNEAFYTLLDKFKKNISDKKREKMIPLLQKSYKKAVEEDEERIAYLSKDANPENYKEIYHILVRLNNRQKALDPMLPLQVNGKKASFVKKDYTNALLQAKENFVKYVYDKTDRINWKDKGAVRKHYDDLKYAATLSPNYRQINKKLDELHYAGTDFIFVGLNNQSNQVIPVRLQNELLNMQAYNLNSFWTVFHTEEDKNVDYSQQINLNFKQIMISPEQVNESVFVKEKDIVDGQEDLIQNGRVVRDSLGNAIRVDRYITVSCEVQEWHQWKQAQVIAEVEAINLYNNQVTDRFPIQSSFVFENYYAQKRGDDRALEDIHIRRVGNGPVPFPPNEQMVYDCGEDLKNQFKSMLKRATQ